jgi:hypothetical protein
VAFSSHRSVERVHRPHMPNTVYYCSQPCCQAQSSDNNRPVPKQLACLTLYNALVQNTLPESAQSKAYQQLQAPSSQCQTCIHHWPISTQLSCAWKEVVHPHIQ